MREFFFKTITGIEENSVNEIIYFKKGKRTVKKYHEFYRDVLLFIGKVKGQIKRETTEANPLRVIICGPTSYEWAVYDLGCLLAGFVLIAIPETTTIEEFKEIIENNPFDLAFIDGDVAEYADLIEVDKVILYNYDKESKYLLINTLFAANEIFLPSKDKIRQLYSVAFTSGTTSKPKAIYLELNEVERKKNNLLKRSLFRLLYKLSFWSRTDNKVLIFMPFSHLQQRGFLKTALSAKLNIVLSDPNNCIKHIITEKPNVMVSVPIVYQLIAGQIDRKLQKLPKAKKNVLKVYHKLRINRVSQRNPIHRAFQNYLFKDIAKLYGGKADYFITGSAATDKKALEIFYKVGVKIYEGYGQSELREIISINTSKNFKLGSVGKPIVKVKISEENEVLVKYEKRLGNKEALNIDENDYILTGDLGYLDKDGFLFLTGRKDNVLVLENGKKVYAERVEKLVKNSLNCHECIITSIDKLTIVLLIQDSLLDKEAIKKILFTVNVQLQDYERIKSFAIRKKSFSVEEGTLTPTLKLKRKNAIKSFETLDMYSLQ